MSMKRARAVLQVFLLALLLASVGILWTRGLPVQSSLYELLPSRGSAAERAFDALTRAGNLQVNALVEADTETDALQKARAIIDRLPQGISYSAADFQVSALADKLKPYRFQLLSARHRAALLAGDTEGLKEEALSNLYGFMPLSLYPVDEEPYGFTTSFLMEGPLSKRGGFSLKDGWLQAAAAGKSYVYLPLRLPEKAGDSLDCLNESMAALTRAVGDDARLSGTPVHTWRASSESRTSMTWLGIISTVMVITLFLGVFSSLRGLISMALTMSIGFLPALAAVVLCYGAVHLPALVFGCSLVGISTDYMVHYLIAHTQETESTISPSLRRSLLLGLCTSCLGYATFYGTGIALLGQIATISLVGLSSVMGLIFAFYPRVFAGRVPVELHPLCRRLLHTEKRRCIPVWLPWCVALASAVGAFCTTPCDDVRSFYVPAPDLLQAERTMAELTGMQQGVISLLAEGENEEAVLQKQEQVAALLDARNIPYTAVCAVVPSAARQEENFRLISRLTTEAAEEIPMALPPAWQKPLTTQDFFAENAAFAFLKPFCGAQSALMLVPGQYRKAVQSLVLPAGVEQVDRFAELEHLLREYRLRLCLFMGIALLPIGLILWRAFGLCRVPAMLGPVVAGVLSVFAYTTLAGISLTLFHVLACFLVMGLGLDYVIFRAGEGKSALTSLAVSLSYLTTLIMFGVLAFTSFAVTRDMGVTICVGLTVTFLLSGAAARKEASAKA